MKVLFFAQAARLAGCSETDMQVEEPVAAEEFWPRLVAAYPTLGPLRPQLRLARDSEFIPWTDQIANHHEIALIPPVSGG